MATEAVKNTVKKEFKDLTKEICKDQQLVLRTDNGSQYESKTFKKEAEYLGSHEFHHGKKAQKAMA